MGGGMDGREDGSGGGMGSWVSRKQMQERCLWAD